MPNYVENRISVYCPTEEKRLEVIRSVFTPTGTMIKGYYSMSDEHPTEKPLQYDIQFDFNKIIPQPDNLFLGSLGKEEEEKFPELNWYRWSLLNWDTKWNSCDSKTELFEPAGAFGVTFIFETAWSMPEKIIQAFAKMYPDLEMYCTASEEMGHFYYEGSKKSGQDYFDFNDYPDQS